jgi:hypothetical protein
MLKIMHALFICFDFQNLSIYDLYVYYYWSIHQICCLSDFLVVFVFYGNY